MIENTRLFYSLRRSSLGIVRFVDREELLQLDFCTRNLIIEYSRSCNTVDSCCRLLYNITRQDGSKSQWDNLVAPVCPSPADQIRWPTRTSFPRR